MRFKKGQTPWNKGLPKELNPLTGRKQSKERIENRANKLRGHECYKNPERGKKISIAKKGKHPVNEWKKGDNVGEKNPRYTGYIHKKYKIRAIDWAKTRKIILKRDSFKCQSCTIEGIKLDVHHIKPFRISEDNSYSNLITLCRSCHQKAEFRGGMT